MRIVRRLWTAALVGPFILGCSNRGADRVLGANAAGALAGVAYFDIDGSHFEDEGDTLLPGTPIAVLPLGGTEPVFVGLTDGDGAFVVPNLAVGTYRVAIDAGWLGDTIAVVGRDTASVILNDTTQVAVGVGFPTLNNLAALASSPIGQRVFATGAALNSGTTFSDSTVHLVDAAGAIVLAGLGTQGIQRGDSVRVRGTPAMRNGQKILSDITPYVAGQVSLPAARTVSTALAATADGGVLNAALIDIGDVSVTDTSTVPNGFLVTVTDGSGPLGVFLDDNIGFTTSQFVPGAEIRVTGVLAATGAASWQLRPRSDTDIGISIVPAMTEDVRTLPLGTQVLVTGVAVTGWNAFGDQTVHLRDATGSIRAIRVASTSVLAGDSVRLRGTVASSNGQRVIDQVTATVFQAVGTPPAAAVTTDQARTADGGDVDAALVSVTGATIVDTATSGVDFIVGIDDGSGRVDLVFDGDVPLNRAGFVPGASINAAGVLVPTTIGTWQLKARITADLVVVVPVVSISQARTMPLGTEVVITGIALNAFGDFSDASVHLADTSGAIRATNVAQSTIFEGDTVRFRGTLSTQFGRRTLNVVTPTRLTNVGPPPATTLTSGVAAGALGGVLDAALVLINRVTILTRTVDGNNVVTLTVNDGSGVLTVELDPATAIVTTPYVPGALINVTGLLVPTGTGTWKVKPRATPDLEVVIPVVSISEARTRAIGDSVVIVGVAVSSVITFGDCTVHVSDPNASIRVLSTNCTSVFVGDSVRFRGKIGSLLGQPVLDAAVPTIVGSVTPPAAAFLTTGIAATAQAGRFDAALVRVASAVIATSTPSGGNTILTVNDGTGLLEVFLDQDAGINTAPYIPGANINVTGVLVPKGGGVWQLKPRSNADLTVNPPPVP